MNEKETRKIINLIDNMLQKYSFENEGNELINTRYIKTLKREIKSLSN